MPEANGKTLMGRLFGSLGQWLIVGLLGAIGVLGGLVWQDLKSDIAVNKILITDPDTGVQKKLIDMNLRLERIATFQEGAIKTANKAEAMITNHLINGD